MVFTKCNRCSVVDKAEYLFNFQISDISEDGNIECPRCVDRLNHIEWKKTLIPIVCKNCSENNEDDNAEVIFLMTAEDHIDNKLGCPVCDQR